ncbi:MAG: helix-turn-helix domain-containing protein [Anaerolineae bacterium]|nr:helix-turn-helix domain-containing protein [Anaerolineae bacterium]
MSDKPKPNLWLKHRREGRRLSQDELASRLQVEGFDLTRATISHWEVGRYQPPLNDARFRQALAKILRVSVRQMLIEAGYEIASDDHSEAGERAASILDQLPPEKQSLALDILERLLEHA